MYFVLCISLTSLLFHFVVLQETMKSLETHEKDLNAVKILYSSLTLIAKVFYSLNYQVSTLVEIGDITSRFIRTPYARRPPQPECRHRSV